MINRNIYLDILFGIAVGDALGVPFEFNKRQTMFQKLVTDMTGFGTYNPPPGTFLDDSSLRISMLFKRWLIQFSEYPKRT